MRKLLSIVSIAAGACSGGPNAGADAGTAVDECATGAAACAPSAVCVDTPDSYLCTCASGYVDADGAGPGTACVDIDECATGAAGCPAACANMPGSFACYVPQRCADIAAMVPGAPDGDYTLYAGGALAKPWTARCVDMASAGVEYLSLPRGQTGGPYNFSQFNGDLDGVTTWYQRVRIDPITFAVDIGDMRFATTPGAPSVDLSAGLTVDNMPFGVAMSCAGTVSTANVDLGGTPFALAATFCAAPDPSMASVSMVGDHTAASMSAVGIHGKPSTCGWSSPNLPACPYEPVNESVETTHVVLQLAYVGA